MGQQLPSPTATLSTALRICYRELLTVAVTSLLVAVASLGVLTVGPALLAAVDVLTTVVTERDTGAPPTERGRARLFGDALRRHVRTGLPLGAVVAGVAGVTAVYYAVGLARRDGTFLLLALVGVYGTVVALAVVLRVGSLRARRTPPPGLRAAVRRAAASLWGHRAFTVLVLVGYGALVVTALVVPLLAVLLLGGVLAVLEVVAYEATEGDGAAAVAPEPLG